MKRFAYIFLAVFTFGCIALSPAIAVQIQHVNPNGKISTNKSPIFKTVSPAEAQNMIESRRDLLLVDIRNPKELRQGQIEGATLMPLWDIINRKSTLPQNKPIMLICAVGGRSLALGKFLSVKGYSEIYNLDGGISAWKKAGLPVNY